MRFEVLVLGNSSATPMYDRHPTSQVINFNEQLFMVDCGEGTQMQLYRYGIRSNKISHIFISHLHGDHYLGLIGLLSSMHLVGRKTDLHLYGPVGLDEILAVQFKYSDTQIRYNLIFHPTNPDQAEVLFESNSLKVSSFPLTHRIPCTGFRFDEAPRPRPLRIADAQRLKIPTAYYPLLKQGIDYTAPDGTIYQATDLTDPAPASRSYAFCSDTIRTPNYLPYVQDVDLMYHEATFLQELVSRAKETYHTTAQEAAEIAVETSAKKLLLGHYSARYKDLQPLLEEAQAIFPATELSQEGIWYLI
ncbi:ribonuclease Z [Sphingobacteriaceae bacterium WQ 2009]|uniref:Ribonuclease Z n=1 Tax=Rhinopithecimicrobium faecis TaxID=2820698 RepID=A0A8T4HCS6_9SPHI|nr:ribonuclease Z [Sphingobacteriaceae bacterium WQ 2009]